MKKKKIEVYFRADGNDRIGAGHIMRCLTIADALAETLGADGKICFLTADEESARMTGRYETVVLGTDSRFMEEELPIWERLFAGREEASAQRLFLVDSYCVTAAYLKALGAYGKVWLLDDLEQRAYPVDAVLNYNAFASPERYRELYQGTRTACFVGSAYVPLRPQFQGTVPQFPGTDLQFLGTDYQVRPQVRKVLVTTGGADPYHLTAQVTRAIWHENCDYYLVAGRFNRQLAELQAWEADCPRVHVRVDVREMAALMRDCDLAVTAGGTTVYELAAVGVPFICFSYAENQEALTRYIGEKDIACYAGAYHREPQKTLDRLAKQAQRLWEDAGLRREYQEKEQKMIDGGGARRIANLLKQAVGGGEA